MILGVVVAVAAAGWSAFWWFAASTVDNAATDAIARAGSRGIVIDCPNKQVRGWPFRMTLICDGVSVETNHIRAGANGLRAVALVYDPSHLIVEVDSPFEFVDGRLRGPVKAQWKSGRASFQLSRDLLDNASITFTGIAVETAAFFPLTDPSAENLQVHVRRSAEPANLDVAISTSSVATSFGGIALPLFDLDIRATIVGGGNLLVGQGQRFFERVKAGGAAIELGRALLGIGEARVEASGVFSIAKNGHLNAQPRIAVANVRALVDELAKIPGFDASRLQPFLSVFSGFGEKTFIDGSPANAVTLSIRDGYVMMGLLPLGRLPPLATNQ